MHKCVSAADGVIDKVESLWESVIFWHQSYKNPTIYLEETLYAW